VLAHCFASGEFLFSFEAQQLTRPDLTKQAIGTLKS